MDDESHLSASEARQRSEDPDHLLGNEPESGHGNPFYWAGVYRELMTFKEGLLEQAGAGAGALSSPMAMREVAIDTGVLTRQSDRYQQRLRHWQQRVAVSSGSPPATTGPPPADPVSLG